jgi:ATP synthase protein I
MSNHDEAKPADDESRFSRMIGLQAARKLRAQRRGETNVWFGLGMSGLVGWSIVVPTLIGAAAGLWIDRTRPSPYSWTLMLMLTGLIIGCLNAWRWVDSEYKNLKEDASG